MRTITTYCVAVMILLAMTWHVSHARVVWPSVDVNVTLPAPMTGLVPVPSDDMAPVFASTEPVVPSAETVTSPIVSISLGNQGVQPRTDYITISLMVMSVLVLVYPCLGGPGKTETCPPLADR